MKTDRSVLVREARQLNVSELFDIVIFSHIVWQCWFGMSALSGPLASFPNLRYAVDRHVSQLFV